MRVFIDPKTGAILRETAPDTVAVPVTPQEQSAFSTSHQGLVQVPSPLPGGGVMWLMNGTQVTTATAIGGDPNWVPIP